jgi:hypothetical protein
MKRFFVIILHAFVGWALCAATIGIGFSLTTELNALIIHAIGAPLFFGSLSWFYFRKFHYTTPITTALIFLIFVMAVDFFLVALVIQRSLSMFASPLGTWIPFALIFFSTYLVGRQVTRGTV